MATSKGENVSGLIRDAVEDYLARNRKNASERDKAFDRALDKACGIWRDNKADFAAIRKSADR